MLNFGKSGLLDVTMLIYGQKVKAAARLQLTRLQDGTYSGRPHFVRKEHKLENAEYMGYTFTKEDAPVKKSHVRNFSGRPSRGKISREKFFWGASP